MDSAKSPSCMSALDADLINEYQKQFVAVASLIIGGNASIMPIISAVNLVYDVLVRVLRCLPGV
eukprot:scaffold251669_cov28-Prasinocladus_malaysianus.AAC.1